MTNRDPARRCMPVLEWPRRDRKAWDAALLHGSVLDERGLAAHWRPETKRSIAAAYGRFLTFLARNGWLDPGLGPADRITPDRLRAYLTDLSQTVAPVTFAGRIRNLEQALRVMVPGKQFPYLGLARRRLKARARPIRNKRHKVVSADRLIGLGLDLMHRAETGSFLNREPWRAALYRDGLTILLLAFRPLRISNLVGMRTNLDLVKSGDHYRLAIDREVTKNHRPYERELNSFLTPYIDRYLEHYRPRLLGAKQTDRVWISWRGVSMSANSAYGRIVRHTCKAFGHAINPHLFRDCAITTLANDDPERVWIGMPLLHHSDPRIAEKHYNQALENDAVRQYQKFLGKHRRTMKTPRRRTRKLETV